MVQTTQKSLRFNKHSWRDIGLRKDAASFGFINRDAAWDGYCGDLALSLADYLTEAPQLNPPIEVVELTSTLSDRYDQVRNGTIQLECGPNPIRPDLPGITFSNPVFISNAQFLIQSGQLDRVNPNLPLEGLRLGVLSDTTTETFVQTNYPRADIVTFSGLDGRKNAIQAVSQGNLDAFVGDGILTYAELQLEGKSFQNFALIPDQRDRDALE